MSGPAEPCPKSPVRRTTPSGVRTRTTAQSSLSVHFNFGTLARRPERVDFGAGEAGDAVSRAEPGQRDARVREVSISRFGPGLAVEIVEIIRHGHAADVHPPREFLRAVVMVRVAVRKHQQVQPPHAERPERRDDHALGDVVGAAGAAGVEEQAAAVREPREDAVAVADRDRVHAQVADGRLRPHEHQVRERRDEHQRRDAPARQSELRAIRDRREDRAAQEDHRPAGRRKVNADAGHPRRRAARPFQHLRRNRPRPQQRLGGEGAEQPQQRAGQAGDDRDRQQRKQQRSSRSARSA